jgi:5-methylcytosine-specific restriction endonuclease McrA
MKTKDFKILKFSSGRAQKCWMCGNVLSFNDATVDHIRPKSKGGRNSAENYKLACRACNEARGGRQLTSEEMRRATGRTLPAVKKIHLQR